MKMIILPLAVLVIMLSLVAGCVGKATPTPIPATTPASTQTSTPKTTKVIPEPRDKGTIVSGSFPAFTIDDCIKHSDAIVIGKVTEILPAKWGENPMGEIIYQDVIVQAERYLYGKPESESIAIVVWGGKIGDTYMIKDSEPIFTVGEKTLLFLGHPPQEFMETAPEEIAPSSYYKVIASIAGKYEFKDGIATDYRGQTTDITTIEKKIASIRVGE